MRPRTVLSLGALLLAGNALFGVQSSGATWTDTSASPVTVAASPDWTPPTVAVSDLPSGIFGVTTVTAVATDERSDIADVVLEYSAAGSGTWTPITTGCTSPSGPSPLTYACDWDTTLVADGDYQVRATTIDAATPFAHSAVSAAENVQVANSSSVVLDHVTSPTRGTVSLTATFYHPVNATAKMYVEYLVGATWTQLGDCVALRVTSLTCTWDTTTFANGSYELRARAEAGSTTVTDVQSSVVVDNTAPTVDSLTVPAGVLSGVVTLSATASDVHSSVASVTFEHRLQGATGWTTCGTDGSAPYTCSLNTHAMADGTHDFRAVATDAAGNTSTPVTASRVVSNAPASVSITGPVNGASVTGAVPVTVSATSDRGVASVRVDVRPVGGTFTEVCTDTTDAYACTWDTAGLPVGDYQLRAVLTETWGGGTVTSSTVGVTVDNTIGTVSITSPAPGSTVGGTVAVAVTAEASNGIASVRVQVRPVGGTYADVCTDTSAPYSCAWNTSAIVYGDYELQAVMTQNNGVVVTSLPPHALSVNNVVGSVSITSPAAGRVRGSVDVTAAATSNAGVTSVRIETRSTPGGTFGTLCTVSAAPYTCSWNTTATPYGTREVRAVMTQGNGSTITSAPVAVTVDNRVLGAGDVQVANVLTAGRPATGDTLTFSYTGLVDLTTVKAGWDGSSTPVTLSFKDKNVAGIGSDALDLDANLGRVVFPQDYVKPNKTVTFTGTMVATTSTTGTPVTIVTVTLGSTAGDADLTTMNASQNTKQLTWTPSTAVKDLFGTACAGASVLESGTNDPDF